MKAPQRKRRHDRRVAHQRIQRERKQTAIAESQHQARNLNGNGEPLKKPRSGEAYDRAFVKAMGERGYTLDYRGQWRRLPTADPIKKRDEGESDG